MCLYSKLDVHPKKPCGMEKIHDDEDYATNSAMISENIYD